MHSVVPHTHEEESASDHAHHHHGPDDHQHHDDHDDDENEKTISHFFTDAIHHPASEIFIQAPESKAILKKTIAGDILIDKLINLPGPERKPPDPWSAYQSAYHSCDQDTFFLLRAPPVA